MSLSQKLLRYTTWAAYRVCMGQAELRGLQSGSDGKQNYTQNVHIEQVSSN